MDTMEWVKIIGGLCGALLVFLLIKLGIAPIYAVGPGEGYEEEVIAYAIVAEEDATTEVADAGPTMADLMASADADKGAKVFGKCKACHKIADGANAVGPYLFGVVGRAIGSAAGYKYSEAIGAKGGTWDVASLDGFIESPKGWAPGTKMGFKGLAKPEDRANLIAYLQTLGN